MSHWKSSVFISRQSAHVRVRKQRKGGHIGASNESSANWVELYGNILFCSCPHNHQSRVWKPWFLSLWTYHTNRVCLQFKCKKNLSYLRRRFEAFRVVYGEKQIKRAVLNHLEGSNEFAIFETKWFEVETTENNPNPVDTAAQGDLESFALRRRHVVSPQFLELHLILFG